LLGWTRLLAGNWRDPRVGVDVLVGVSAGLAMTILYAVHNVLPPLFGQPEPMPMISNPDLLKGFRFVLAIIAGGITNSVTSAMLGVVGVLGFVLLFRRVPVMGRTFAGVAAIVCFTPVVVNGMFPPGTPWLDLLIAGGITTIFVITILRAGLLATMAALFTHFGLLRAPITTDFSSWHASAGWWLLGTIVALGLGASYVARSKTSPTTSEPVPV
jgi:serine/threonine-protein kinase